MMDLSDPNVGLTDRWLRGLIGLILLAGAVTGFVDPWRWLAGLIGLYLMATSALRVCPIYRQLARFR